MTRSISVQLLRIAIIVSSYNVKPASGQGELNERNFLEEMGETERELTSTLTCPVTGQIEKVSYYEADIELAPQYQVSCTDAQLQSIGQEMSIELDSFFANDNNALGPISLSHSCVDEGSVTPNEVRRKLTGSHDRELLLTSGMTFIYKGGGRCRYCYEDDDDGNRRRRRLNEGTGDVPVTVFVETDNYAPEMGFRIETDQGVVVYNNPQLTESNSFFEVVINLQRNQTYVFVAHDLYGDGWCCNHGHGWAAVIMGTGETPFLEIDGQFGYEKRVTFTLPYFATTVIPEVEEKVSAHLTHKIWVSHENNPASCLQNSGSSVGVKLAAAESMFSCPS